MRALLVRGMLTGLLAGLLVFGVAKIFGETQVDQAIAFEAAADAARLQADLARGVHDLPEPVLVSRSLQAGWGLLTGVMVYCTAWGGLFALVFAYALGRANNLPPRAAAAVLALIGFVAIALVPGLKYPANPPAIGHPDTIGLRTALYAGMMLASVAAAVGALAWRRHLLAARRDVWSATLMAVGLYAAAVAVAAALLPGVDEVPARFPAVLLWRFRIDGLGMQAVMWATLGLVFGAVVERRARRPALAWR